MPVSINAAIFTTSLAAVVAVGLTSAAIVTAPTDSGSQKADRLTMVSVAGETLTIETRTDGLSVLRRVPLGQ